MNKLVFITGGARSGKSTFAEKLARELYNDSNQKQKIAYIATGMSVDAEFNERIKKHKERRSEIFQTYEEGVAIDKKITEIYENHRVFIIECMATWLGNIFHEYNQDKIVKNANDIMSNIINDFFKNNDLNNQNDSLLSIVENYLNNNFKDKAGSLLNQSETDKVLIIVSNETGLGIVPDYPTGRNFRDILGRLNQMIAKSANFVYLLVSGIPLRIK